MARNTGVIFIGFDTETFHGNVKVLCASDGQCAEPTHSDYTLELLQWLYEKAKDKVGFFFNIEYDMAAILKPWILNHKIEMKDGYAYKIGDYKVRQFPNKAFIIKYKNKKAAWFFDVANFFTINFTYRSLDDVAKEFLNEKKNNEELGIDRKKIGEELGYYEKHRNLIKKYCVNDAALTEKLARLLSEMLEKLGFPTPQKWFSKASISKEFLKLVWSNKKEPALIRHIVKSSYRGGIFQTYYLGHFNRVYDVDINSAYPFAMSIMREYEKEVIHIKSENELTELTKRLTGLTVNELLSKINLNNANMLREISQLLANFYGFVHVKMKDMRYYGWKDKNKAIKYQRLKKEKELWITFPDYLIQKLFNVKFEFIDAIILPTKRTYAFPFIHRLFELKDRTKKEYGKESAQYYLIKVIINALYGALAQHNPRETRFTNYIYASYITALTRFTIRALQKQIENVNGKVIAISTDGLVATKLPQIEKSDELGGFTVEKWNEYVHYMNGIYFYRTNKWKTKARGLGKIDPESLRKCDDFIYQVELRKPTKIRTAIRQKEKNPAEFEITIKHLDPIRYYVSLGYHIRENWKISDFWFKRQKIE